MMKFDGKSFSHAERVLPSERAVAISVGGTTHAVMMASPEDLVDFAYGFLLGEGVIADADDVVDLVALELDEGVDVQVKLRAELAERYQARQRAMAGPVGCGLCGVESLELALPKLNKVTPLALAEDYPFAALRALHEAQVARKNSGALHGAALLDLAGQLIVAREDIGRHNALDKAIGAAMRKGVNFADCVAVLSSRVSVDLAIKVLRAGIGTLIARASPSDLALDYAGRYDLNLVAPVFEDVYFLSEVRDERG